MSEQQTRRWYWFWGVMLGVSLGVFISDKAEVQRQQAAAQRFDDMAGIAEEYRDMLHEHLEICPLEQNLLGANQ